MGCIVTEMIIYDNVDTFLGIMGIYWTHFMKLGVPSVTFSFDHVLAIMVAHMECIQHLN